MVRARTRAAVAAGPADVARNVADALKSGPVLWIDCADSQPCIGTAGSISWHLKATGKLFHSGLPHKAINAIELASEAVKYIQDEFYKVRSLSHSLIDAK